MKGSGRGVALGRAALAGNPSDLYGGAVLAVTLPAWSAEASIIAADDPQIDPPSTLVAATLSRFGRELQADTSQAAIRWRSTIPRTVGLGGSSALVIATTRALAEHCGLALTPAELAEFALAVETEELGIVAGPQDRLAQSHGGLTFMDFSGEEPGCEALEPSLLPPLLIAWRQEAAGMSGDIHAGGARGPQNSAAVAGLASAARAARSSLRSADHAAFAAAVDRTLDLRAQLVELDQPTLEMALAARSAGAVANYTGSGGAIVVVAPAADQLRSAAASLRALGCAVSTCRWEAAPP